MKILSKLPTPVKKVLYYVFFPFVFVWITLGVCVYKLGELLSEVGDRMTDYQASKKF